VVKTRRECGIIRPFASAAADHPAFDPSVQTEAKAGQTHYKGLFNAFSVITKEEGIKALFKGGVPRMIRSSPQSVPCLPAPSFFSQHRLMRGRSPSLRFAVTLVVYEWLKVHFPVRPLVFATNVPPARNLSDLPFCSSACSILTDRRPKHTRPCQGFSPRRTTSPASEQGTRSRSVRPIPLSSRSLADLNSYSTRQILLDCHEDFGRTTLRPTGGEGVLAGKPLPRAAKVLA
jgi:hypothetical protein